MDPRKTVISEEIPPLEPLTPDTLTTSMEEDFDDALLPHEIETALRTKDDAESALALSHQHNTKLLLENIELRKQLREQSELVARLSLYINLSGRELKAGCTPEEYAQKLKRIETGLNAPANATPSFPQSTFSKFQPAPKPTQETASQQPAPSITPQL